MLFPESIRSFIVRLLISLSMVMIVAGCSHDDEFVVDPSTETENEKYSLLSDFQKQTIDYFEDIALGFEFGNASKVTRKWVNPVKIRIDGEQPDYLLEELSLIIEEINTITTDGHSISLTTGNESGNFRIFFGSGDAYALVNPSAADHVNANRGLFYVNWDGNQNLTSGDMYVDTERVAEVFQRHLLREELTQALGLAMDSPMFDESIFQSSWTDVTSYTDLDRELIRLLYHPMMVSNLNIIEVRTLLINILFDEL